MKKTLIVFLIMAASTTGICLAGANNTGNAPNPPMAGNGGPNTMDNRDTAANSALNY